MRRSARFTGTVPLLLATAISQLSYLTPVMAGVNSWTKPTSGSWEEQAYWSLGVLPNATQDVALNNPGWKALAITANTAQNFPDSMRIQGLEIDSPVDSYNVLLMNFSGFERPLQATTVFVKANSAVVMQFSALELVISPTNSYTGNLLVGGTFNQGDYSQVKVRGFLDVGRLAMAPYFLTNGTLTVDGGESMGGFGPGTFVQYGGFNNVGSLQVNTEGEFNLYDGEIPATNGLTVGGGDYATTANFYQYGGTVTGDMAVNGHYYLNGGTITGRMSAPAQNSYQRVDAAVVQACFVNEPLLLGVTRSGSNLELTWPAAITGAFVQSATALSPNNFTDLSPQPMITVSGNLNHATVPIGMGTAFLRLRQ